MSKSIWSRLSKPFVVLVAGLLLSGCGGEETIPLKKPDFIIEAPQKDAETKGVPGKSAGMRPDQRPGQVK